jgi:hypothetical protein
MNRLNRRGLAVSAAILSLCAYAAPASAQATRTWVSGTGDDANPCSRTAPCKTFAGAISKTAAGGEINCIDTGGYGAVTITKSMTIDCHYTEGGVLAAGNGIVVNALSTDVVTLRGLDIFGVSPPTNGIRFIAGGALHIEDCVIRRFNAASSAGISFAPSGNSQLYIVNTTITDNGNGTTGGGIIIAPSAGGSVKAVLNNVRVRHNGGAGIQVNATSTTTPLGLNVAIIDSESSGNTLGLSIIAPNTSTGVNVMVTRTLVSANSNIGISSDGAFAAFRVGASTITNNTTGVASVNGGAIRTYADNQLNGNFTADGTFTGAVLPHQ